MAAINNVTLTGRLAADPESVTSPGGVTITRFTLAVDRMKEGADFIRITTFGKTAELVSQYLGKGDGAAIVGRIQTGKYENKNGDTVYTTDVIGERVVFLSKAHRTEPASGAEYVPPQDIPDTFEQAELDIPF